MIALVRPRKLIANVKPKRSIVTLRKPLLIQYRRSLQFTFSKVAEVLPHLASSHSANQGDSDGKPGVNFFTDADGMLMIVSMKDSETPRFSNRSEVGERQNCTLSPHLGSDNDVVYSTENVGLWKNTSVPYRSLVVRKSRACACASRPIGKMFPPDMAITVRLMHHMSLSRTR